jgi:hypothetical protein
MPRIRQVVLVLAAGYLSACGLLGPPVFLEREFAPDVPFKLEWQATGKPQQVWLRVRVTGGHELSGPVEVSGDAKQLAAGRFSLEAEGIVGSGRSYTTMKATTGTSWRGQVQLFVLPEVPVGTPMAAQIELHPGSGVEVGELKLQVRSESPP